MKTLEEFKAIATEWNALVGDEARLRWLIANPDVFELSLDNDHTGIYLKGKPEGSGDDEYSEFYDLEYTLKLKGFADDFGDRAGVQTLFRVLGITAEPV